MYQAVFLFVFLLSFFFSCCALKTSKPDVSRRAVVLIVGLTVVVVLPKPSRHK